MVDINSANLDDLCTLKHIGPKKAAAIIEYRDRHGGFKTKAELLEVKGIGEKIYTDIERSFRVGPFRPNHPSLSNALPSPDDDHMDEDPHPTANHPPPPFRFADHTSDLRRPPPTRIDTASSVSSTVPADPTDNLAGTLQGLKLAPGEWERVKEESCSLKKYDGRGGWERRNMQVKIAARPFAEGGMRLAFLMLNLDVRENSPERKYVAKVFKQRLAGRPMSNEDLRHHYEQDVIMQQQACSLAYAYNQLTPPKPVVFLDPMVGEIKDRPRPFIFAVEKYVTGTFAKHNNNFGWCNNDVSRNTPQAFSHFTYHYTKGELIVVDIQGVGDYYTDPQIHRVRVSGGVANDRDHPPHHLRGRGSGDKGQAGVDEFFRTHVCNPICIQLSLERPF
mmetsp:Transcript_16166/g.26648  ORF Transcript_16166/g.26648 Transcript_16166/m.26648 type:complete len:391 (+) Transcript_16166:186-1358(+)|eukprot:CAMPEP_0184673004 /NCGR_PEP_ID=MMETSP0308-20130426/86433_1 /TAXON_ID=38269 /ORGANISM="Gloeochaete witrockiana, Strain SAG 46.84" /LENGTH=390 /DNA_ID=CAMNT_0027120435 /DNA_START=104 /DNA_END=1276 /DNA_ORIENTATION=-